MRILVTGGAGFLGSHLCERLLNGGNEVICLDNYFSGSKDNIRHLLQNPYFEMIRYNVIYQYNIECDQIYNLACPASPVHYQKNPTQTIDTSVQGMINAVRLARKLNIKILQASTSEVYGDPLEHPQKESYWGNANPIGDRSMYDESKRCAEAICMAYNKQFKTKIKIARIFNTYGPRMAVNDGRVVSNFIVQALHGEDITIYGDGNQTRSFQYVDDCVEGLITLMETPDDFIGPVNIGNPGEFTMLELATLIIKMSHSRSKIVYKELPSDDPKQRCPDITLAKSLGWLPEISLEEGLTLAIDYFKKIVGRSYLTINNPFNNDTLQKGKVYGVFEEGETFK
jgi:UDP-glucuronate decarboxylase